MFESYIQERLDEFLERTEGKKIRKLKVNVKAKGDMDPYFYLHYGKEYSEGEMTNTIHIYGGLFRKVKIRMHHSEEYKKAFKTPRSPLRRFTPKGKYNAIEDLERLHYKEIGDNLDKAVDIATFLQEKLGIPKSRIRIYHFEYKGSKRIEEAKKFASEIREEGPIDGPYFMPDEN
jgi:hypothetical protein